MNVLLIIMHGCGVFIKNEKNHCSIYVQYRHNTEIEREICSVGTKQKRSLT